MFSHITVGSNNLERAALFYDAVLAPFGLRQREIAPGGGPKGRCWILGGNTLPRFYVYEPFDGADATAGNGTMVAFEAESEESVDASYAAGMALGGVDAGKPGPREHYGKGYYGAYLHDPDGNKIHIVFRGDVR